MNTPHAATNVDPRVRQRRQVFQSIQVFVGDVIGRVRLPRRGKRRDKKATEAEDKDRQRSRSPSSKSGATPLACEDNSVPQQDSDPPNQDQNCPRPLSPTSEVVSSHDNASGSPAAVTLPDELLSNIFEYCVPGFSRPKAIHHGFPVLDPFDPHPHAVRRCLTQVCRTWRTVAINTPTLWTTLVLGRALKWDVETLDTWLRYSRSCPLDVLIRPTTWSGSKSRASPLLKLLKSESGRIRCFIALHLHSDELRELFPLDSSRITQLLSLEVFYLRSYTRRPLGPGEDALNIEMGLVYTPKLRYLQLAEATLIPSFMTTTFLPLQWLVLGACKFPVPSSTYLQFLACCPNLSSMWLSNEASYHNTGPMWPETRLTLPALHDLRFFADHTPDTMLFLRSLHIPSLQTLRFGQYDTLHHPAGFVLQVFWHLLTETASTLENLLVNHRSLPIGDNLAGPLLRNMSNLRSLVIHDVCLKPDVLECLIPEPDTPPEQWPCPRLAFLTLDSVDIEGDALPRLISARPPLSIQERDRLYYDILGSKQGMNGEKDSADDVEDDVNNSIYTNWWDDDAASVSTASKDYSTNGRLIFIGIFQCCILQEETMAALVDLQRTHGDAIEFHH